MRSTPLHTPQFENLFRDFQNAMKAKGYSGRQRQPYFTYHIREFLHVVESHGVTDVAGITTQHILQYQTHLLERPNARRGGGLSDASVKHQLLAIRLFLDHLLDTEVLDSIPVMPSGFIAGIKHPRQIATVEEIKELYSACQSKRDRAMLSLAYGCGLRRSELEKLTVSDVLLSKGQLIVRDGKFGKSRTIPLSDAVCTDLREYLVYERVEHTPSRGKPNPAFLLNKQRYRFSGEKANTRLKELIAKTENPDLISKNLTLHCLRHSIASHLADRGASIEFVQKFLGHSDVDATNIYAIRRKRQTSLLKQFGA